MNSGLSNFHRILKDQTRSQIVLLLNEKGSLSYTDLMNTLGIANTGKLNYHLKVLGDLVSKNADVLYFLTEKGKLASRLLVEFADKNSQYQAEWRPSKWSWILAGLTSAIIIIAAFTLYARGIIDQSRMLTNLLIALSVIASFVIADQWRKRKAKWSPKKRNIAYLTWYVVFGALAGLGALLIAGSILLVAFETVLQSAGFDFALFPFRWWVITSFVAGPIIGAFAGYLYFKRNYLKIEGYA